MTADPYAMSQEIIELQTRVAELSTALETVTEQRDHAVDSAQSLFKELDSCHAMLVNLRSQMDRLRLHLQQGIEL